MAVIDLSRVDVPDFLQTLGIKIEGYSGDNALFLCPWHSERHPSARMNVKTTQWLCSVGCGKGTAVSFLSMLREMDYEDAKAHIANRYGSNLIGTIDGDLPSEVRRILSGDVEQEPARVLPSEGWIAKFRIPWEVPDAESRAYQYMVAQRGFHPKVLERWQIGYDETSDRVTIPVRDAYGSLVGFKARALDADTHPRYLILGTPLGSSGRYPFHTYRKSEYVFGIDRLKVTENVPIVEGELNVIAMDQRGFPALGVAGSEFSETQRRMIVDHCRSVVVFFDGDTAGLKGASKVATAVSQHLPVRVVMDAEKDAAEMSRDEIASALGSSEPALFLQVIGRLPVSER